MVKVIQCGSQPDHSKRSQQIPMQDVMFSVPFKH